MHSACFRKAISPARTQLLLVACRSLSTSALRQLVVQRTNLSCVVKCPVRWISCTGQVRSVAETSSESKQQQVVLYEGPLARSVRMLKMVSLTSCTLTLVFMPVVGNPAMPVVSKVAVASTVCFFGLLTTGILHRVTRSYVCSIRISASDASLFEHDKPAAQPANTISKISASTTAAHSTDGEAPSKIEDVPIMLSVDTINIFGQRKTTVFPSTAIKYPKSSTAFASFFVGDKAFFIHQELIRQDPRLIYVFRGLI